MSVTKKKITQKGLRINSTQNFLSYVWNCNFIDKKYDFKPNQIK